MNTQKSNINYLSKKKDLIAEQINCERSNYFGETLKELRLEKRLTQDDASKLVGITQAMWSAYEVGKSRPDLDTIILIAKVLKISPFALIGRSLDKSKYFKTGVELTFKEYEQIEVKIINKYRTSKGRLSKKIKNLI